VNLFHRAAQARKLDEAADRILAGGSLWSDGKGRQKAADGYRQAAKKIRVGKE
jgi:hypothetical protein